MVPSRPGEWNLQPGMHTGDGLGQVHRRSIKQPPRRAPPKSAGSPRSFSNRPPTVLELEPERHGILVSHIPATFEKGGLAIRHRPAVIDVNPLLPQPTFGIPMKPGHPQSLGVSKPSIHRFSSIEHLYYSEKRVCVKQIAKSHYGCRCTPEGSLKESSIHDDSASVGNAQGAVTAAGG